MTNNEIEQILINKWAKKELAHFYVFRIPPSSNSKETLLNLTKDFLAKIAMRSKSLSFDQAKEMIDSTHPDLLILSETDNAKPYTLNDEIINDFIKFNKYASFELQHRFVVLDDAHRINELISNKFLKTLEEPTDNTTIIFLEHTGKKLLTTIESRSLDINWRAQNLEDLSENLSLIERLAALNSDFNKLTPEQLRSSFKLSEFLKNNKHLENLFFKGSMQHIISGDICYNELRELEEVTKWNTLSQTFHNPLYQRVAALHKLIIKSL